MGKALINTPGYVLYTRKNKTEDYTVAKEGEYRLDVVVDKDGLATIKGKKLLGIHVQGILDGVFFSSALNDKVN